MPTNGPCPPPSIIEQAALGELSADLCQPIIAHVATCPSCGQLFDQAQPSFLPPVLPLPVPTEVNVARVEHLIEQALLYRFHESPTRTQLDQTSWPDSSPVQLMTAAPDPDPLPRKLGKFELQGVLGHGGMGAWDWCM